MAYDYWTTHVMNLKNANGPHHGKLTLSPVMNFLLR